MVNLNLIGLSYDNAVSILSENGYTNIKKILVSSNKVKNSDIEVVVKFKIIDDSVVLYVGQFLYNI